MNIKPITSNEKPDSVRMELNQKQQQEYKLIGKVKRHPGHALFSFNTRTCKIKLADIEHEVSITLSGEPLYSHKTVIEKDCIYMQALNEKSFRKKLIKSGYLPNKANTKCS